MATAPTLPIEEPSTPAETPAESKPEEDKPCTKRIRKPSQRVLDILSGHTVSSSRPSDPVVAPGVQVLPIVEQPHKLEGEGTTDWMMAVDLVKHTMVAEMSEAEGLEPHSLAEVKHGPDWLFWEKAIFEELKTLEEAGTWELVDLPAGCNLVGSKWVFRVKKDAAGQVISKHAWLLKVSRRYQVLIISTCLHWLQSLRRFVLSSRWLPN